MLPLLNCSQCSTCQCRIFASGSSANYGQQIWATLLVQQWFTQAAWGGKTFPKSKCQDLIEKSEVIFKKFHECSSVPSRLEYTSASFRREKLQRRQVVYPVNHTESSFFFSFFFITGVGCDSKVSNQVIPCLDPPVIVQAGLNRHSAAC